MVKTKYRAQANTEWNLFRTENYDRIIEAMESNLAGLKEVSPCSPCRFETLADENDAGRIDGRGK